MRILFDGYWWSRGPLANRSVQRDIISTWSEDYPEDELVVALRRGDEAIEGLPARVDVVRTRLWPHALSNVAELPRLARRARAELVIAHNYTPLTRRCATFIHDAMFIEHPEWFSLRERLYFWPMLPTARWAAHVFTSSGAEAERIRRDSRGRLRVTPIGLGVPQSLTAAEPQRPAGVPDGGFALCVGRLNIRKNLAAVIHGAVESTSIGPGHPLLVVGSAEYSGRVAEVPTEFRAAVLDGSVRFLGRVSDPELAWLYRHAALAITLSLDEGFGLPAVEAAVFGAPLVASDIAVFRETVGGYADFVDPLGGGSAVAAAIDARWGRVPGSGARATILEHYSWSAVVGRLRQAVLIRSS